MAESEDGVDEVGVDGEGAAHAEQDGDLSEPSVDPPSSAGGRRNRRGERRRWRGGAPPAAPALHAMFTDVYSKPEFYQKWIRRVQMWRVRVRH